MNTCTDPIKDEIAKLSPRFDLQLKSRQLAELIKEIRDKMGGISVYSGNPLEIQVYINSLLDISQRPAIRKLKREDYPYELSTDVGGVKYFTFITRDEWLEFAKDNQICPECGKDFEWTRVGEREYRCPNDC